MAYIGLRHPVWAPIEGDEIEGQPLKYGKGVVLGEAISAEVSFNRSTAKLYADDKLSDSDNSITGGTIRATTDEIEDEVLAQVMNMQVGEGGEYTETGKPSPYGGFGYVRARKKGATVKYTAMWVHKVQLGITTETANTKAEQTEYQTPTLEGDIMGVVIDDSMETVYRSRKTFDKASEAIAWVDAKAGITAVAAGA